LFGVENLILGDDEEESDPEGLIEGVGFIQPAKITCDQDKLYLDSCATNSSMFADEFLSNIHKVKIALRQNCNAGSRTLDQKGMWMRFPMWRNSDGIANLLSVPWLKENGYLVTKTYDKWFVHTPDRYTIHFSVEGGLCHGMPFVNMLSPPDDHITPTDNTLFGLPVEFGHNNMDGVAMVETVRKNFEGFTAKEVKDATYARKAQGMVGSPSDDEFASMVSTMRNCPIKRSDIANATAIFGPNRNVSREKTVRRRPERVEVDYIQTPRDYHVLHKFVTLTADLC
jgi:hypothetical protein